MQKLDYNTLPKNIQTLSRNIFYNFPVQHTNRSYQDWNELLYTIGVNTAISPDTIKEKYYTPTKKLSREGARLLEQKYGYLADLMDCGLATAGYLHNTETVESLKATPIYKYFSDLGGEWVLALICAIYGAKALTTEETQRLCQWAHTTTGAPLKKYPHKAYTGILKYIYHLIGYAACITGTAKNLGYDIDIVGKDKAQAQAEAKAKKEELLAKYNQDYEVWQTKLNALAKDLFECERLGIYAATSTYSGRMGEAPMGYCNAGHDYIQLLHQGWRAQKPKYPHNELSALENEGISDDECEALYEQFCQDMTKWVQATLQLQWQLDELQADTDTYAMTKAELDTLLTQRPTYPEAIPHRNSPTSEPWTEQAVKDLEQKAEDNARNKLYDKAEAKLELEKGYETEKWAMLFGERPQFTKKEEEELKAADKRNEEKKKALALHYRIKE